jgi:hypothetical protein
MLYHTLSAAVEASKFIAIACIRNPQRLHRFCRHRAHPHSLSLLFSLPPSVQTLTLPRSFGTSKAPDRNPPRGISGPRNLPTEIPPGAYRDLESSRQKLPGAYRDLESSRQKLPGVYRDLDQFTTSKEVHLHVFPPSLRFRTSKPFFIGPNNYSSFIHTHKPIQCAFYLFIALIL